jgi:hypothetical protein
LRGESGVPDIVFARGARDRLAVKKRRTPPRVKICAPWKRPFDRRFCNFLDSHCVMPPLSSTLAD